MKLVKNVFIALFTLAVAAAAVLAIAIHQPTPADRLFFNGQILTMDRQDSIADALYIRDGKVVAAGPQQELRKLIDAKTEFTDLHGKTVIPGFIDAHGHFPGSGIFALQVDLSSPPVGEITRMSELQAALADRAKTTKPGHWIVGMGYDDTLLAEQRQPTRDDLDMVSTDHPIAIMHVSGHMAVVNTKALATLGIDRNTPDPEGGTIVRDTDGRPTGLLQENAMLNYAKQFLNFGALDFLKMVRTAAPEYARAGVTTSQSGGVSLEYLQGLRLAQLLNLIPFRQVVWPTQVDVAEALLDGSVSPKELSSDRFTVGAVKIIADGSIQGYTGFLKYPYYTPYQGDEDYRGKPNLPLPKLKKIITELHEAGLQIAVHANGDAAIDDVIEAFDEAQKAHWNPDPRLVLVHAQTAREDQLDAMQKLGITPTFFSAHVYYWGDRHRDIFLGPERAKRISPVASAARRGMRFSVHLDTPVVPMQPLLLWWNTVTRHTASGQVLGPEQRISPMRALRALTIDAAWQVFQENNRGSLEPDKWADLVVLSGDPLANPEGIKDLSVLETIVGGRTIYAAP